MPEQTIYIVDDNEDVCQAIKFLLNSFLNLDVKTYICPYVFLEDFSDNPQGVVIIDLDMPSMNGIHLIQQVKKIKREIGVIIISGHGTSDAATQSIEAGAQAFIVKPLNTERLLEEVEAIVHESVLDN